MYGAPDVMRAAEVRDGKSTNARTEVHRSQRRVVQHVVAWDWKEVELGASCSRNPGGHARSSSTFSHVWKCGKLRKTARACEALSFTSCSGECARRQHARSRPCGRMECGVSKPPQVGTLQVLCKHGPDAPPKLVYCTETLRPVKDSFGWSGVCSCECLRRDVRTKPRRSR